MGRKMRKLLFLVDYLNLFFIGVFTAINTFDPCSQKYCSTFYFYFIYHHKNMFVQSTRPGEKWTEPGQQFSVYRLKAGKNLAKQLIFLTAAIAIDRRYYLICVVAPSKTHSVTGPDEDYYLTPDYPGQGQRINIKQKVASNSLIEVMILLNFRLRNLISCYTYHWKRNWVKSIKRTKSTNR